MVYHKLLMADGRFENVTLNLGAIAELNKRNKPLADEYFAKYKEMQKKGEDFNELDMAKFIYIAYACAHLDEDIPSFEEFLTEVTDDREELGTTFENLFNSAKKKTEFRDAFRKATKEKERSIKLPRFELEDIEDYYTYYVLILGIPEKTFYDSDLNFLSAVAANKAAYDGWMNYAVKKAGERRG